jgi:hypothetical protein
VQSGSHEGLGAARVLFVGKALRSGRTPTHDLS